MVSVHPNDSGKCMLKHHVKLLRNQSLKSQSGLKIHRNRIWLNMPEKFPWFTIVDKTWLLMVKKEIFYLMAFNCISSTWMPVLKVFHRHTVIVTLVDQVISKLSHQKPLLTIFCFKEHWMICQHTGWYLYLSQHILCILCVQRVSWLEQ